MCYAVLDGSSKGLRSIVPKGVSAPTSQGNRLRHLGLVASSSMSNIRFSCSPLFDVLRFTLAASIVIRAGSPLTIIVFFAFLLATNELLLFWVESSAFCTTVIVICSATVWFPVCNDYIPILDVISRPLRVVLDKQ